MIKLRLKLLVLSLLFMSFALTEFEQNQRWAGGALLTIALVFGLPVLRGRIHH
jgi:hypothetical protein